MATPPARTDLADTYPNPSNAVFRTGIGKLHDYLFGLLGSTGNQAEARALLGVAPAGQCRLTKSGSNLLLSRYQGSFLTINNVNCLIPSAGVTLAPTGLTVGTVYYIYATAAAGVVTALEASTTGHSTDATTGVEIKTGDATRTLVGMAQPVTGPAFVDTAQQRNVISWFNAQPVSVVSTLSSTNATNSTTNVVVCGPLQFLAWANRAATFNVIGGGSNTNAGAVSFTVLGLDSTTVGASAAAYGASASAGGFFGITLSKPIAITTDGFHQVYVLGSVNAGTGSWLSGMEVNGQINA